MIAIDATLVDVTRIISGGAGSLTLEVPKSGTRPTSDRVREAIFSSLEAMDALDGARVLDLYAGSGALGLEAASRGATTVVLVENDANAATICKRNAKKVQSAIESNLSAQTRPLVEVAKSSVKSYLSTEHRSWDIIFADPPYDLSEAELGETLNLAVQHAAADAILIVERSSRSPEPMWPNCLSQIREKRYGETLVWQARTTSESRIQK